MDATVKNWAPDIDCIVIKIGEWEIIVDRGLGNRVCVSMIDHEEGSETRLILGQEGETQVI